MKMFKSVREVLKEVCKENDSTPLQEIVGCISLAALIPMLWLALYMLGAR